MLFVLRLAIASGARSKKEQEKETWLRSRVLSLCCFTLQDCSTDGSKAHACHPPTAHAAHATKLRRKSLEGLSVAPPCTSQEFRKWKKNSERRIIPLKRTKTLLYQPRLIVSRWWLAPNQWRLVANQQRSAVACKPPAVASPKRPEPPPPPPPGPLRPESPAFVPPVQPSASGATPLGQSTVAETPDWSWRRPAEAHWVAATG